MRPPGTLRAFWAIDLPQDLKAELEGLQTRLRARLPEASWPPAGNFHLTLAFLGNIQGTALPQILAAGASIAKAHAPFVMQTGGLGCFPSPSQAKILWLGLQPSPQAERLALGLQGAMRTLGVPMDEKPFIPHLTLARLRSAASVLLDASELAASLEVRELVLFESRPGARGSIYTPLETIPLG